jgi:hypothetical protein
MDSYEDVNGILGSVKVEFLYQMGHSYILKIAIYPMKFVLLYFVTYRNVWKINRQWIITFKIIKVNA